MWPLSQINNLTIKNPVPVAISHRTTQAFTIPRRNPGSRSQHCCMTNNKSHSTAKHYYACGWSVLSKTNNSLNHTNNSQRTTQAPHLPRINEHDCNSCHSKKWIIAAAREITMQLKEVFCQLLLILTHLNHVIHAKKIIAELMHLLLFLLTHLNCTQCLIIQLTNAHEEI